MKTRKKVDVDLAYGRIFMEALNARNLADIKAGERVRILDLLTHKQLKTDALYIRKMVLENFRDEIKGKKSILLTEKNISMAKHIFSIVLDRRLSAPIFEVELVFIEDIHLRAQCRRDIGVALGNKVFAVALDKYRMNKNLKKSRNITALFYFLQNVMLLQDLKPRDIMAKLLQDYKQAISNYVYRTFTITMHDDVTLNIHSILDSIYKNDWFDRGLVQLLNQEEVMQDQNIGRILSYFGPDKWNIFTDIFINNLVTIINTLRQANHQEALGNLHLLLKEVLPPSLYSEAMKQSKRVFFNRSHDVSSDQSEEKEEKSLDAKKQSNFLFFNEQHTKEHVKGKLITKYKVKQ